MTEPLRVLLLEDSRFDAELLREHLLRHRPDARLDIAANEADYRRALAAARYDVILSDYEVPPYDGGQALDHALQVAPGTPFIFVSGVIGEDNAVELLKRGAIDYVSKGRLGRLPLVLDRALREVAEREAREAATRQLRAAREDAERANRAKDRFLAVLSHELRTPLTPIAAAAYVLERTATVPEPHRHLLPMIQRNVALEARLIDDLLDLTSISAGKLVLRTAPVDMHALVRNVIDMLQPEADTPRAALDVQLGAPASVVQADEARMQQVVWNIVRNAFKFTPPEGRVELRTAVEDGQFVFSCADTGIGIEPAALARIFAPFEQADEDVTRRYGGLGLGLAIAHGVVREHGGRIAAHSEGPGRGARFTLRLALADTPVDAKANAPAGAPHPSSATAAPDGDARMQAARDPAAARRRLLLVEDSADAAEILRMHLHEQGYAVTVAGTRAAALGALESGAFDVMVSDLGLPDGSGLDLARAWADRVPAIALSGFGTAADREASRAAGFREHLVKPAGPADLREAIERVLAA